MFHAASTDTTTTDVELPRLDEVLELAELERPRWGELRLDARRSGLVCEGDGDGDGDAGDGDGDAGDGDAGDGDGDAGDGAGTGDLEARLAKAEKAAADKDKELRTIRREQEERDRKAREADGKFEDLYKSEKERADKAEQALEDYKAEVENDRTAATARELAITALKSAGVKNPERDVVHIDLSKVDSETTAKRAAKRFADDNPDLLEKAPTRQKRGGGSDDDDDDRKDRSNGREPLGPERLRRHFAGKG